MKIIVFTGSRAELFLQMPLWVSLKKDFGYSISVIISYSDFETQKLMKDNLIREDLDILNEINLINQDNSHSKRISKVLFEINKLDLSLFTMGIVFADRYESFGFAIAVSQIGLPLIHIEAGDVTMGGTYDDNVRHAISSLSSLFITTNEKASRYLLKNKIYPNRIINCGIFTGEKYFKIRSDKELIDQFKLKKEKYDCIIIFTYHPLSSFIEGQISELNEIYKAFYKLSEEYRMRIILTGVNADYGGQYVSDFIDKFKSFDAEVSFHRTLGANNYLGLMNYGKQEKVLIAGNSSSIVKEVPFFECVGVLIGARQLGRKLGNNTFYTDAQCEAIKKCISSCISDYDNINCLINPYYVENAVHKAGFFIKNILSNNSSELIKNVYKDLN